MSKIKVQDLATKMGLPEQDLLFKLKSIGVRVEGKDALIDTDVIKAILQGKALSSGPQRDVILRDPSTPEPPSQPKRRPAPPPRRPGPGMRPPRRRAVVNKSERIKTLPPTERPTRQKTPEEIAAQEIAAEEAATTPEATQETAAAAETAPAVEAEAAAEPADVAEESAREVQPAPQAAPEPTVSRRERRAERRREEAARGGGDASRADRGTITISEGMTARDLAEKLGIRGKDLLKQLFERGVMATVNHVIEPDLATELAEGMGFETMVVSFEEEVQLQQEDQVASTGSDPRAPVVTVMGHVDHGKTSLLDAIRSSSVTDTEHGGITQHIAAYKVDRGSEGIVFLDTPGHEAFTQLRARGAKVTDIVVLVVAADDGVMPQTKEAIDHARSADVPILVAINKIDRPNANPDTVKKGLADHELLVEDWGGDVVSVPVSAIKGDGVEDLLEMINITSEMLELKADASIPAQGVIIEARKEAGRGTVATVLIQNGTLSVGDVFVSGSTYGRARIITNDRGDRVKTAVPATPVEVSGFNELPNAGDTFQVVEKESKARSIAEFRKEELRQRDLAPVAGRMSLENLFNQIGEEEAKELPVIIKADVQGSVEVLKDTLVKMSTDKVKVKVIHASAGAVSTNDVLLASAAGAIIYGFNVRPEGKARELADKEEIDIRLHTVIYELTEELKAAMTGLLDPTFKEVAQGRAEVREIFKVPRIGFIAGCHVVEGLIPRNSQIRLLRDNIVIHEGKIGSLRRFKEDASEVRSGFDCGIGIDGYQDLKPGDMIEAYTQEAVAATL